MVIFSDSARFDRARDFFYTKIGNHLHTGNVGNLEKATTNRRNIPHGKFGPNAFGLCKLNKQKHL